MRNKVGVDERHPCCQAWGCHGLVERHTCPDVATLHSCSPACWAGFSHRLFLLLFSPVLVSNSSCLLEASPPLFSLTRPWVGSPLQKGRPHGLSRHLAHLRRRLSAVSLPPRARPQPPGLCSPPSLRARPSPGVSGWPSSARVLPAPCSALRGLCLLAL